MSLFGKDKGEFELFRVEVGPVKSGKKKEFGIRPMYKINWYNPRMVTDLCLTLEGVTEFLKRVLELQGGMNIYEKVKDEDKKRVDKIRKKLKATKNIEELLKTSLTNKPT